MADEEAAEQEEPEEHRIDKQHMNMVELLGRMRQDPVRGKRDCRTIARIQLITENRWTSEVHEVVAYDDLAEEVLATYKQGAEVVLVGFLHWGPTSDLVTEVEVVAERIEDLQELKRRSREREEE